jgi:hypothetical protein
MKYIKLIGFNLMLILGLGSSLMAQPTVRTGTTTEQASQLIFWYDQVFDQEGIPGVEVPCCGRFSFFQVTNASTSPVSVKVQFFVSEDPDPGSPPPASRCVRREFVDIYPGQESHSYDLFNLAANASGVPIGFDVLNTKGFIVVTAIDGAGKAISHNHLFGTSYVFDQNALTLHRINAMGRKAVDFGIPFPIVPAGDGELLDGVGAGLVLIQPETLKFNFESTKTKSPDFPNLADVIGISFKDNYDAGQDGAYAAEPGSVTWQSPFIIDVSENPKLCGNIVQNCFFDIGLNEEIGVANPLLDGEKLYCPGNFTQDGWAITEVVGYDGFENELSISAFTNGNDLGDAYWMQAGPSGIPPSTGLAGDANQDGMVTSADITCVILAIFGMSCPMPDCNGDGSVTSADITCVILEIFNQ